METWTMKTERTRNAENIRLEETREHKVPWKKWGPYLNERQWGTVREDYSPNGGISTWRRFGIGPTFATGSPSEICG